MSGATQIETGYTAAPAPDQPAVSYEYAPGQMPDAKRGRYAETFALQQQQQQQNTITTGGSNFTSQSKKAIVVDATRVTGRCLWFDSRKNYGAIQPDQSLGTEGETGHSYIFVHGNDVEPGSQQLRQGDAVEFCRGTCPRGRPKAAKVVVAVSSSTQYRYHPNGHGSVQGAQRGGQQQHLWGAQQPGGAQGQQQGGAQPPGAAQQAYTVQSQAAYAAQQQQYASSAQYQQYAQQGGQVAAYALTAGVASRRAHPHQPAAAGYAAAYAQQQRPLGRVKWFDRERKQYGFITPADGSPDLFMHAGDVIGSTKLLSPGDAVEFDYGVQAQSGRPKALEVVRLVQHVGDDDEDDGRTTIGKFASGDEPLFEGARLTGTVARFDQQHRWGFITPDDETLKPPNGGDNFFVHGLDVLDISDSHPIDVGQAVEFSVVRSRSRRCKAVQCLRVNADARQTTTSASSTQHSDAASQSSTPQQQSTKPAAEPAPAEKPAKPLSPQQQQQQQSPTSTTTSPAQATSTSETKPVVAQSKTAAAATISDQVDVSFSQQQGAQHVGSFATPSTVTATAASSDLVVD